MHKPRDGKLRITALTGRVSLHRCHGATLLHALTSRPSTARDAEFAKAMRAAHVRAPNP